MRLFELFPWKRVRTGLVTKPGDVLTTHLLPRVEIQEAKLSICLIYLWEEGWLSEV